MLARQLPRRSFLIFSEILSAKARSIGAMVLARDAICHSRWSVDGHLAAVSAASRTSFSPTSLFPNRDARTPNSAKARVRFGIGQAPRADDRLRGELQGLLGIGIGKTFGQRFERAVSLIRILRDQAQRLLHVLLGHLVDVGSAWACSAFLAACRLSPLSACLASISASFFAGPPFHVIVTGRRKNCQQLSGPTSARLRSPAAGRRGTRPRRLVAPQHLHHGVGSRRRWSAGRRSDSRPFRQTRRPGRWRKPCRRNLPAASRAGLQEFGPIAGVEHAHVGQGLARRVDHLPLPPCRWLPTQHDLAEIARAARRAFDLPRAVFVEARRRDLRHHTCRRPRDRRTRTSLRRRSCRIRRENPCRSCRTTRLTVSATSALGTGWPASSTIVPRSVKAVFSSSHQANGAFRLSHGRHSPARPRPSSSARGRESLAWASISSTMNFPGRIAANVVDAWASKTPDIQGVAVDLRVGDRFARLVHHDPFQHCWPAPGGSVPAWCLPSPRPSACCRPRGIDDIGRGTGQICNWALPGRA